MSASSIVRTLLVICAGAALGATLLTCAFLRQRVGDWMSPTNAAIGGAILGGMLAGAWRAHIVGLGSLGVALGGSGAAVLFQGHTCDGSIFLVIGLGCFVGGLIGGGVDDYYARSTETKK